MIPLNQPMISKVTTASSQYRPCLGMRKPLGGRGARTTEERDAERFHEARHRQSTGQREARDAECEHEILPDRLEAHVLKQGQEREPFAHEAVERWQRRDGDAADQEGKGGKRHAMDEPAQVLHVARAGGIEHGAGTEEQQALEQAMVEGVEQRGSKRERPNWRKAFGSKFEKFEAVTSK